MCIRDRTRTEDQCGSKGQYRCKVDCGRTDQEARVKRFGHVPRIPEDRWLKMYSTGNVQDVRKKKRGRSW